MLEAFLRCHLVLGYLFILRGDLQKPDLEALYEWLNLTIHWAFTVRYMDKHLPIFLGNSQL